MGDEKRKGVANVLGGIFTTWMNNRAARKENEKNREFNLQLAQMENQWNVEQWQRENDYNTPMAQIQRLKEAGINPDMVYGGGIANTSASSPQMTAGAPSSPTPLVGMPNAVDSYLDSQLKQAQIDNINADTKKKGSEASILASDAKFRDEWNAGLIKAQNVRISLDDSARNLNDVNATKAMHQVREIDASASLLSKQFEQITQQIDINRKISDAQLKQISAETGLTLQQTQRLAAELPKVLQNLDDQHEISLLGIGKLQIENRVATFQAEMHGAFNDDTERELRFSDQCLKGLTRLVDAFTSNPFPSSSGGGITINNK